MPAKNLLRVSDKDVYLHIYNKGVEGRTIFVDQEDSDTFLNYIREYLTNPSEAETQKKSFTVKGKTYHGTPHQPKNYYKKVELLAYSINGDHFHLVLRQTGKDSIQGFIRSLCTRYSIFFNKKYQRHGSLFEGPYKSAHIQDTETLRKLITYLHKEDGIKNISSHQVYTGEKSTPWMSKFEFSQVADNKKQEAQPDYKTYAENYNFNDAERDYLSSIILEKTAPKLERRILDKDLTSITTEDIKITAPAPKQQRAQQRRIPEIITLSIAFLVLFTLGLRNVSLSSLEAKSLTTDNTISTAPLGENLKTANNLDTYESVLSASDSAKAVDPISLIYSYTVIKKGTGTTLVYKEKDINSGAITTAHDGDHFVAYPIDADWYQVRFSDDSKGYVLSKYIDIEHNQSK